MLQNTACFANFLFHGYLLQDFLHPLRKQLALIPCGVRQRGLLKLYLSHLCEERLQKNVLEYLDTFIVLCHVQVCIALKCMRLMKQIYCKSSKPSIILLLSVKFIWNSPMLRNTFVKHCVVPCNVQVT